MNFYQVINIANNITAQNVQQHKYMLYFLNAQDSSFYFLTSYSTIVSV